MRTAVVSQYDKTAAGEPKAAAGKKGEGNGFGRLDN